MNGLNTGTFVYWKEHGSIITEQYTRRVILHKLALTKSMRMTSSEIQTLKNLCETAKFV